MCGAYPLDRVLPRPRRVALRNSLMNFQMRNSKLSEFNIFRVLNPKNLDNEKVMESKRIEKQNPNDGIAPSGRRDSFLMLGRMRGKCDGEIVRCGIVMVPHTSPSLPLGTTQ